MTGEIRDAAGQTIAVMDALGNLTSSVYDNAGGDLTTYTWSIDNMCLSIALPNATLNTFVYDADLKVVLAGNYV